MDWILWLIMGAFVGWEAFAHFVARNKGSHTLSNRIWALEAKYPASRAAVATGCLVLFAHLVFHFL